MPKKNRLSHMLLDCKSRTVSLSCFFSDVIVVVMFGFWIGFQELLDGTLNFRVVIGNLYGVLLCM